MSSIEAMEGQFDQSLVPLAEHQRQAYPHVIYQRESDAIIDQAVLATALIVAQEAGLPVVADVDYNEETGRNETVIRSSSADHSGKPSRTESALFCGTTAIVERTIYAFGSEGVEASDALVVARDTASVALHQIIDNEGLSKAFRDYYGGLRWSTDQERLTRVLFEQAAELDLDFLAGSITKGEQVRRVMYDLDIELPAGRSSLDIYDMSVEEILAEVPDLDYRRLANPEFAASDAGQRLAEGYRKLCGSETGRLYEQYPRPISHEGKIIPKPVIPLAKFPIIEALMADEVSLSRPKMKYDMGPQEVTGFILHSDSLLAQQSLVESVTRRLPREQRYVFDGPNEFQHKHRIVSELMATYRGETDPTRQAQFRDQLLEVFEAYTVESVIAQEMREQYWDEERRGLTWHPDISQVKGVIQHMLTVAMASPDAEMFIGRYMPDYEKALATERDPLALSHHKMILLTIDALNLVNADSNPTIFEHVGRKLFSDETIARTLRKIAELNKVASELGQLPEVLLAMKAREKFQYRSMDDKKSNPDSLAADAALDVAQAPSKQKSEASRLLMNEFIMEELSEMADTNVLEEDQANSSFFDKLVDKISYGDTWRMSEIPKAHLDLVELATHPNVPDEQRAHILWKLSETVEYAGDETAPLLVNVILDGYRLMLGNPDGLRMPGSRTREGLAALNNIAWNNRSIFKYASEEQLMLLSRYKMGVYMMADRVAGGVLTEGTTEPTDQMREDWQTEATTNLKGVMDELNQLEKHYEEFLHFEEVKVKPGVFYPWLLKSFLPFWHRLQREAGPNSSDWQPSGELRQLYAVMKNHVDNRMVFQDEDYPEDFDIIEDGGLGTLLLEGYNRMVVPNDIKYNNVVYHDGLSFMHTAVVYMPDVALKQLKIKYAGHRGFIDYIEKNRAYWRKSEDQ